MVLRGHLPDEIWEATYCVGQEIVWSMACSPGDLALRYCGGEEIVDRHRLSANLRGDRHRQETDGQK
jgi:hypothetical protein